MKPRRSLPHRAQHDADRAQARSTRVARRPGWLIAALIVIALGGALLAPRLGRGPALVPEIDSSGFDRTVARLIESRVAEVRRRPRSGQAWGNLGLILFAYSRPIPARTCLDQAEQLDSRNPRWPYFQSLLLAAESPGEALKKLRRTVELCGSEPEAPRWRLATLLAEAGQWSDAESELDTLLRDKPDFLPATLLKARAAQARGNILEALSLAQRCADDPRTTRGATALLASLHLRQGNTNAAAAAQRRLAVLPADTPVGDPFQAEAARLRGDPRALTEQAHPLLAAGRLGEAEAIIQQLIQKHSSYAETWLVAGRWQLLKKNYGAAEQALRRHLELDPQSSQGLFQLGMVQLAQQQFAAAAATFLKATQLKPDFGPAHYNRGLALTRAGNARDAIPAFREAIRHNPDRIDPYLMLADAHFQLGDGTTALSWLEQAAVLHPAHPGVRQLREKALRAQ